MLARRMSIFEGDAEGCEREETPWFVPRQASCVRAVIAHCTGRGEQNVVRSPSSLVTWMALLDLGAGEGRPLPMVIQTRASSIDRGACIKDLSQYPREVAPAHLACAALLLDTGSLGLTRAVRRWSTSRGCCRGWGSWRACCRSWACTAGCPRPGPARPAPSSA